MRALRSLFIIGTALVLMAAQCQPKRDSTIVVIATVKSLNEAVEVFTKWAVEEETKIAAAAVEKCKDASVASFESCVKVEADVRRTPIDKAKKAMQVYNAVIAATADVKNADVVKASTALTESLAGCGINVGEDKK